MLRILSSTDRVSVSYTACTLIEIVAVETCTVVNKFDGQYILTTDLLYYYLSADAFDGQDGWDISALILVIR